MYTDSILEEMWKIKDDLAAMYDYDVDKMAKALRESQEKNGRKLVVLPPKRIKATDRAAASPSADSVAMVREGPPL